MGTGWRSGSSKLLTTFVLSKQCPTDLAIPTPLHSPIQWDSPSGLLPISLSLQLQPPPWGLAFAHSPQLCLLPGALRVMTTSLRSSQPPKTDTAPLTRITFGTLGTQTWLGEGCTGQGALGTQAQGTPSILIKEGC